MPTSTQTSTGRSAPAAVSVDVISSTPRTESTQHTSVKSGCASSSAASQRNPAASTSSLARITSRTPNARKMRTWLMVAAVTAHAPASNWRASSCGAMCVLPCGASSTPRSRHHRAIVARLCSEGVGPQHAHRADGAVGEQAG